MYLSKSRLGVTLVISTTVEVISKSRNCVVVQSDGPLWPRAVLAEVHVHKVNIHVTGILKYMSRPPARPSQSTPTSISKFVSSNEMGDTQS